MSTLPPVSLPPALRRAITATSFGFIVVQLDVTIVNVALPHIGADLGAGMSGLQWVVDAYTLSFAVFLLSAGALGDRFGSKRIYLTGFFVFAVASLACGLATSGAMLVIARALQGMGAALLVPSSLALLNHASGHDHRLRARAVGLWTAASAVAISSGPIVGALLLHGFGWRSIFYVNLPLCALGAYLTVKALPDRDLAAVSHPLDPLGQGLAIAVLTCLTGAVIEFRSLGGGHPLVLAGFAVALVGSVAFVQVERRVKAPMIPLSFFSLPNFSAATLFGIIVNLTYYGVIFVLSLYLQQARGYTAIQAGLAYLPLTVTFIGSNLLSGWMASHFGSRIPMVLGSVIGALGFVGLACVNQTTSFLGMLPGFVLIPAGMGLAVPAMTTAILGAVERSRSGTASAVLNTARQAGGAIGVAIFGALASGSVERIASGLRLAAITSVILLVVAAGIAATFIHSPKGPADAFVIAD